MGFSHDKTTHHFRLFADGGVIEVTANDLKDTESRDQIRMHLSHIARMFAEGNFQAPMIIHDRVPPGVPTLQRLKAQVSCVWRNVPPVLRILCPKARDASTKIGSFSRSSACKGVFEFTRLTLASSREGASKFCNVGCRNVRCQKV